MKVKQHFFKAEVELISMAAESVIATSTGVTGNGDDGDGDLIAGDWTKS